MLSEVRLAGLCHWSVQGNVPHANVCSLGTFERQACQSVLCWLCISSIQSWRFLSCTPQGAENFVVLISQDQRGTRGVGCQWILPRILAESVFSCMVSWWILSVRFFALYLGGFFEHYIRHNTPSLSLQIGKIIEPASILEMYLAGGKKIEKNTTRIWIFLKKRKTAQYLRCHNGISKPNSVNPKPWSFCDCQVKIESGIWMFWCALISVTDKSAWSALTAKLRGINGNGQVWLHVGLSVLWSHWDFWSINSAAMTQTRLLFLKCLVQPLC